ncbi:MAG TPA: hypothetical protein VKB12_20190 [Pyrinomonadaceae bacterium]|nr:hypothetical protein [Pyrinomonadaceae bacterium]
MNWNPQCAYCGHVSHPDSEACERCDFPLGVKDAGVPPYAHGAAPRAYAGYVPSMRFEGAGDVIGPMLEVFRKHFQLVLILVVVVTSAEVLLRYALMLSMSPSADVADAAKVMPSCAVFDFAALPGGIAAWLISQAATALLSGSFAYAVLDLQHAGASSAGACLRRGLKSLPKLFLIRLMYTVATFVGYLMLVVPGVVLSVKYALALPAAVAENAGPFESFGRSSELTDGYKGLVFVTYFLWGLAVMVVGFVVTYSFTYGGPHNSLASVGAQALVQGVLNATTAVLSVFIFLGLLGENGQGLDASAFAHEAAAPTR